MKRLISLVTTVALLLSLCLCLGLAPASADTPEDEEEEEDPSWSVLFTTDDFGDPTDQGALQSIFIGEDEDDETVLVLINLIPAGNNALDDNSKNIVGFTMVRTNYEWVSFSPNDELTLKVKIGDTIYEDSLLGLDPDNGTMTLISDSGRDDPDDCFAAIYRAFMDGEESIRFILQIDDAKYNFTMDSSGFAEGMEQLHEVYEIDEDWVQWPFPQQAAEEPEDDFS